jgi:glycosyltransferase involved in cell wall biosynthesis
MRLAFIVSHPVQYYVPLYRELAKRDEVTVKVFYTWRDAGPALDVKFEKTFAWDIPLMEGYEFEVVPNTSPAPGTHHRRGLINPDLVGRVEAWQPDAVHITGYNYVSHGQAIKKLSEAGIPVIFRGDSHLLDGRGPWWKWLIKKSVLSKVYSRPSAFAYVGKANREYYRAFRVPEEKLFHVPHTIEVGRFAEPNDELETKALAWRRELGIPDENFVFLYAAKLEPRKRPMELLEAFLAAGLPKATLLFVGSGELEEALKEKASHSRVFETAEGKLTRIKGRISPGGCADRTGGECSSPGTPGFRGESSEGEVAERESHSRQQGDRQLEELSEAVKLRGLNTDGVRAAAPTGLRGECSAPSDLGARKVPSGQTEDCKLYTANSRGNVVFLEFQNQSAMPVVYRLGDALVLPSGYWETWGLAVNEAQACGRPSLVSDCVGCAQDIIRKGENGMIFRTDDWEDCVRAMRQMVGIDWRSKREAIQAGAWEFDTARGVDALLRGLKEYMATDRRGLKAG